MARSSRRIGFAALAASAVLGCTIGQKEGAVLSATAEPDRRRDLFEATLRALDEKPEYVDEFFRLALTHPRTLERFVGNTAAALDERPLAVMTADALVQNPDGLRRILVETLDAARTPAARGAIARAIAERPEEAARAMAERPETIEQATRATIDAVVAHPEVRHAFLSAMRARQDAVATLIIAEPDLAAGFAGALVKAGGASLRDKLREVLGGDAPGSEGRAQVRAGGGRSRK